eukprot:TRINITY_DN10362_c0_g1_i1.p1 TRINITY_DN10362_c0_g1~~TRINITY_DN10362_c0_g1_i1.p1  ORF type:complete len:529 (+),score=212.35 TRINITY_DN10362_c0_g1_i1:49-1635(+)
MPAKKKSVPARDEPQYTANQLFTGFMVAVMSFLVFALWPDMSETRHYEAMLSKMNVKRGRVTVACEGSGTGRECGLFTRKPVSRGDTLLTIPYSSAVLYGDVLKEFEPLMGAESEVMTNAFKAANLDKNYHSGPFVMTFKIWHEMKLGSSSLYAPWFDLLPKVPQSALFMTEDEAVCLDRVSFDDRNRTLVLVKDIATAVENMCATDEGKKLNSCYYLDVKTLAEEVKYAVGLSLSRTWGDFSQPMLIPMVDFAFTHPDLCNPNGDGDVKCTALSDQFMLTPSEDQEQGAIVFKTTTNAPAHVSVHAVANTRAPWETLAVYGYADYAVPAIPDLEFIGRVQQFAKAHQLQPQGMVADHPMKQCFSRVNAQWTHTGAPKKELKQCWIALHYFVAHPEHLEFDSDARAAYTLWKEDKKEQAKFKYFAARSMANSGRNIATHILSPRPEHCSGETGRLPTIRKTYEITDAFFQKVFQACEKAAEAAFAKWQKLDDTADKQAQEPQPPQVGEVEEDDLELEGDEDEEAQKEE